ncbi:MAG: SIMPL domain-containing protein [Clostridiales bacterium]|jgi:uncharacterized protein YggE|nr:SIMPL domain-containing protein [Clostridiales bacterium]
MQENKDRQIKMNTLTVTGFGSVTAIPDMAIIRLGVYTTGDNLSTVQNENARISQMILEGLSQMNIDDISTYQYNIDKLYDFDNGRRIDRGYFVLQL